MMDAETSSASNFSGSDNATTTVSPAHNSPAANPVIIRASVLLILAVFNLGGNGFTLLTIRLTPRLWTKTNFILASMLVADVITGVSTFWYAPFLIAVYIFNNPCQYNVAVVVTLQLMKVSGSVNILHLSFGSKSIF